MELGFEPCGMDGSDANAVNYLPWCIGEIGIGVTEILKDRSLNTLPPIPLHGLDSSELLGGLQ